VQLTEQLDEICDAIQMAILVKFPVKLFSPSLFQSILRNITLHLPRGYEIIAGTMTVNIHQYYKLSKVAVLANSHYIKLILYISLNAAHNHFTLYRILYRI
jgi:hypothetical protein